MIRGLFNSIFKKQPSIGELMNIDANRQQRASGCSVSLVATYHEINKESFLDKFKPKWMKVGVANMYYVIFKLQVVSETGGKYFVFIRTSPDFNLSDWGSNKVKIYCGCNDFKFRSCYTLNSYKALFLTDRIKIQLGSALTDAPKKAGTTLLCKHSFAAVNWLIQNYANVMKTI